MVVTFNQPFTFHLTNGATFTLPPGQYRFDPDHGGQQGWFDVFDTNNVQVAHIHVQGGVMS